MRNLNKKNKGFTLVELLIVIVILGIIAATQSDKFSGVLDKAKSDSLYNSAFEIDKCIRGLRLSMGLNNKNVSTNPSFLESGNDILDVLMGGDVAVIAGQDFNYNNNPVKCPGLSRLVKIDAAPTAGGKGTYNVDGYTVTLTNIDDTHYDINYALVATSDVKTIAIDNGNATSFDGSQSGVAGDVRWNAAANGTNTLSIRISK